MGFRDFLGVSGSRGAGQDVASDSGCACGFLAREATSVGPVAWWLRPLSSGNGPRESVSKQGLWPCSVQRCLQRRQKPCALPHGLTVKLRNQLRHYRKVVNGLTSTEAEPSGRVSWEPRVGWMVREAPGGGGQ